MPAYQTAAAGANYTVAGAGRMIPDVAALAGWPLYALANPGLPVTAKQQSGTTATLTTTSSYGMDPGEDFTVAGVGAPFDGTFPIVSTTATTISYTVATSATVPLLPVSPTGTMTQTCVSIPCPATQFPWTQVYGTSAATPLVAVGIANVNAVLSARGLSSIDNSGGSMDAHTIFYDPRNASAMTDVTVGDNDIFNLGGWAALTGYDMTTGMGVPNFATLASLLIQRLAPTPTPTPTSTGTTPTTVPTTAPTPTPAPSAQPTSPAIPTPRPTTTAQPRDPGGANPERTIVAGPGVVVLSAATAQLVTPRTMIDTPAIRVRNAPTVDAQPSAPISLVARGLRPGTAYTIRIAGTDSKAVLGGTTADSKGLTQLPVFLLNKAGSYTIEIVDRQTKLVTFVKLAVKKRR